MIKKLIGDRAFYKKVIGLMIPIMIQTGITNFVNMLDNITFKFRNNETNNKSKGID